jgi:LysM repeat protein
MLRPYILTASLLFLKLSIYSQSIFNSASILEIQSVQGKNYFIVKNIKGQDIQSIAKAFHITSAELLQFNGYKNLDAVKTGSIKVPLNDDHLLREKSRESLKKKEVDLYLPVYYTAKKGESLYKVAKVSGEPIASLQKRNKSIGEELNVGEKVLLGWIPLSNNIMRSTKVGEDKTKHSLTIAKEKQDPKVTAKTQTTTIAANTVKAKDQLKLKKDSLETTELLKKLQQQNTGLQTERGIAHWAPSHRANNKKYALHDSAPINSTILLYNPMLKKSTSAKVIGRIPKDNFGKDVNIVLSSAAAESLGARDTRFMIDMKFQK